MVELSDEWPTDYNPGAPKHLHVLGVIAVQLASFERSIDALCLNISRQQHVPKDLTELYYYSLNEEKRIEAVRIIFSEFEKDKEVTGLVDNMLNYFQWCRECRNQLLHAERYPPAFGGDSDMLHLTKRVGKQSPKTAYMKFSLETLRSIADRIRAGHVRCLHLRAYLRFRGRSPATVPVAFRPYILKPLPGKLRVPKSLRLRLRP
jgi:hypothetical protein